MTALAVTPTATLEVRALGAVARLEVTAPGDDVAALAAALSPLCELSGADVTADLRVRVERCGALWMVSEAALEESEAVWSYDDVEAAAEGVLAAVNRCVIAVGQRAHVLLHAAAVVVTGRSLLLVAPSGSGKSTLATALVAAGAGYLTDEAVALSPVDVELRAYPKPLALKPGSLAAVRPLLPASVAGRRLIDPRTLGADVPARAAAPALVVLPRWVAGAECTHTTLTAGVAVLELAQSTFGFAEHGVRDLHALAGLVRRAPVVRLHYGDLSAAVARVHELVSAAPRTAAGSSA